MHIEDLRHIRDDYDHIYLSPHLDDAALSCGGAIAVQRAAGQRVLVVTICTAAPSPLGPFSGLAQELHAIWRLTPAQVIAARLAEEQLAIEQLDADSYWVGMLDAIYRCPQAYHSRTTLFATPAPDDQLLPDLRQFIAALVDRAPSAKLYAPLGVGSHVDHLITFAAAVDSLGDRVALYEDFPYAAKPGALGQRLAALEGMLSADAIAIDAGFPQKVCAIAAYASQLDELFGGTDAMVRVLDDYAKGLQPKAGTYGERLWSWKPLG